MSLIRRTPNSADRAYIRWWFGRPSAADVLSLIRMKMITQRQLAELAELCPAPNGSPVLDPSHPARLDDICRRLRLGHLVTVTDHRLILLYGAVDSPFHCPEFQQRHRSLTGTTLWLQADGWHENAPLSASAGRSTSAPP